MDLPETTVLIRCHQVCQDFNYQLAVDWATQLLGTTFETESVLIVASFASKPVRNEIQSHVSAALRELGVEEFTSDEGIKQRANYYVSKVLMDLDVRSSLEALSALCRETNYDVELMPFYLIDCGWRNLDEGYEDYYFCQTKDYEEETLNQ